MAANSAPDGFEKMLSNFVMTANQAVEMVLTIAVARDPEKYTDAVALVRAGRLIPRTVLIGGRLKISLIDVNNQKSIGEIFHYWAPALDANGVPN